MNFPQLSIFFSALQDHNKSISKDLDRLILMPGMEFNSRKQWWDNNQRTIVHQGIDIQLFASKDASPIIQAAPLTVPVAYDGTVINCVKDFLDHSIFLLHDIHSPDNWQLLTAYGHLTPFADLKPGISLKAGDIIGTITKNNQSPKVPEHLHLSVALISPDLSLGNMNWQTMSSKQVRLIDPLLIFPDNSYELHEK